ncbi:Ig-like domain-containing protein [Vibrio sp. NC2]|uniref:Ig-like domain-containing protein n=2 Tax=Vibrio TaxID=662 RepID=UPI00288C054E|nr:Ig-like domain-containing protein [Vibrio sp. NC2]
MDPILYIEVGGVVWQVFPDGTWLQLPATQPKVEGVQVVSIEPQNLQEAQPLTEPQIAAVEQQLEKVVTELVNNIESAPQQPNSANDQPSSSASFIAYVRSTLDETLAEAGFDTRPTEYVDEDTTTNEGNLDILLPSALLTVDILDGGDGYENQFEVPGVTITGTAVDVRDGRTVVLTITDVNGTTVTTTAITSDETYVVNGVDLSSLEEGDLQVDAVVADDFGNSITANDSTIKDTLANIEVDFDGFGDEFYNKFEVENGALVGTVTNVEDGQVILITITDSEGLSVDYSTNVSGNSWTLENQDYSNFAEGELTVVASTIDIAGNPTSATDTIVKDTLDRILVRFDGFGDNYYNENEVSKGALIGAIFNVEDGQVIDITITDSNGLSVDYTTVVSGNFWSLKDQDYSGFSEGELTVVASTTDVAGNTISSTDTIMKDTLVNIGVDFSASDDEFYNQAEVSNGALVGTVANVEEGQTISITITDSQGKFVDYSTTVSDGNWTLTGQDYSAFAEGQLIVEASVIDIAGNTATSTDSIVKDTLASISVNFSASDDEYYNSAEVSNGALVGTVVNVEDGQTVSITITDVDGKSENYTAIVSGGGWSLTGQDYSAFVEGILTVEASVTDVAGNTATSSDTIVKDTLADISVNFDGFGDEYYNSAEVSNGALVGTVTNVEDGQEVSITITDVNGKSENYTATVTGGEWTLVGQDYSGFAEGIMTVEATITDVAGNTATSSDTIVKDTLADISVDFDGFGDEYYNSAEVSNGTLVGTVINVEDGQTVSITITDVDGKSENYTAVVSGGEWTLIGQDYSAFAEGTLTVEATVSDVAGNTATSSDTIVKDTLADISVDFDGFGDEYYNSAEVSNGALVGTVTNVEDGQTVSITITDADGKSENYTAIVSGGEWSLIGQDYSAFAEGTLTVEATVTDIAGNTATSSDTIVKDTLANISVDFDGFGDEYYNLAEITNGALVGTVTNVEDGQTVSITITDVDGKSENYTAIVSSGEWTLTGQDYSAFAEGELTVEASVTDVAGNTATSSDTIVKDTLADIDVDFDGFDDEYYNSVEVSNGALVGTVANVEDGQTVSITITDVDGKSENYTAIVSGGGWSLTGQDYSAFVEGILTVEASVTDIAGNTATSSDTIVKDTLADISVNFDGFGDEYYNSAEVSNGALVGTVTNVEDGQEVSITITDVNGKSENYTATVTGGEWTLVGQDYSGFAEGIMTVEATVTDVAGNTATSSDTIVKDTLASIGVDFSASDDEFYNSAEVSNGALVGMVADVEDGQAIFITITDSAGTSADYSTVVSGGTWTLTGQDYSSFSEGILTVQATVTDVAGNVAISSDTIVKDTLADINVDFDGFGDEYYNQSEVVDGVLVGTVANVEDGQTISITITDSAGTSVEYSTTVSGRNWTLTDQDYSDFAEGTLTVEATVTDVAGNTATSSDTIVKDTLISIDVDFSASDDEYYNLAEITNGALVGTVADVEDGQTITITITDSLNVSQVYTTTVAGGNWTLTGQDYSDFAEGILTVEASVTDVAGNKVTSSDTIVKDTLASITAEFDDADNILNTEEVKSVRLQGVVQNVEDGQTVDVTVTDSNNQSITLQTVVVAGAWSIDDVDLSAFADGNITVEAVTVDIAGNEASGTDSTAQINTVPPVIDIDTLSGFSILDFRSGDLTVMQGTTDVSEGLPVYIEINDGTQTLTFVGVVDASGGWLVENIDVSSLDPSSEWIIDARVANSIGNEASDDMPSIILPGSVSFSESTVGIFGDQTQVADINIQFADEFAFSANQVSAEGVTSQGQSIAIALESDGQVLKATRTDGTLVFEAKIVGDAVEITFYQAVDQKAGEELLQTAIIIEGLQIDDDGTTELVLGELPITILDSEPLLFGESYLMVEGETSSGNVLSNDIDLDTALTISSVEVGGVSKDISGATPAVFNTGDGVLTVFANGQWTFEANRNLDHQQDHIVTFNYVAADSSGDFGSATATIDITDGAAGQILDDSKTVTEVDVTSGSQTINAQFTILGGSDNPDPDSIQFSPETVAQLEALGITSGGDSTALTYTLSADGLIITAKQGDDDVFSFSMTTTVDGNNVLADIVLVIERPLDHVLTSDLLTIPLNIIGTDTDGTALENGQISWVIEDGNDPSLVLDSNASVNESDLSNASVGEVSSTGTFSLGIGSDYLDSVFFDLADQPQLFSGGEQIYYTVSEDGTLLTGYAGPVVGGDVAFTVSFAAPVSGDVDSSVDYVFTLYKGLDQTNGTDSLPFTVTARDSDNDKTKLDLNISITDGGEPFIGSGTVELSETPIANTTPDGVRQSAVVNLDITASHDPIVYLGIDVTNGQAVLDGDGEAVTHNGEALTWRDNGDGSFDAILSNGDVIMQIRLPSDYFLEANASGTVAVEIDLYRSIDHGTGLKDTELNIPTTVVVIDSDGSRSTQESDIKIYDGKDPAFSIVGSISVDEDGLIGDNEQTGTEEPSPSIAIIQGSDDIASVSINIDAFDALGYSSGGRAISLQDVNADGWYYAQDTSGNDIFRIRFNNDGTTEFNLYAPLDHATGDGENNLAVNFELVVTDADGDSSDPAIYSVNVTDAVPTSRSGSIEMVEGDDLNGQFLTEEFTGADGAEIISFTYRNVTYTFDDVGTPITINLINDYDSGTTYGQFTLSPDGSYQLTTNPNVSTDPTNPKIIDDIDYLVRDADGDEVISNAELVLDDNEGFIRYEDSETTEDNDAIIVVSVATGDVDQSETVTAIEFSEASLQGGSLYLDGVLLQVVDGKVTLSGNQLTAIDSQFTSPNGQLTYRPALHESNTTSTVILAINAIISTDTVPKELTADIAVSVLPVADAPDWSDSVFTYQSVEDDADPIKLDITAQLVDQDTSEELSYTISGIPDGLNITLNGNAVKEGKEYTQNQIDKMEIRADENLAGRFEFEITAIATEAGNTFANPDDRTADIVNTVVVEISPDADTPILSVKDYKGLEDENIFLKNVINGALTDTDGSESLSYQIEVQDGWAIQGGLFDLIGPNTYLVSAEAIENGTAYLIPKEDISSFTEELFIKVTAVSYESTVDSLDPVNVTALSDTKTINIFLKGVVDEPIVVDGGNAHWEYDSDAKVISNQSVLNEDGLIRLDFVVQTTDDDVSEEINILLTNIPEGTLLVDAMGKPVSLTIAYVDDVTGPVLQVSNAQLNDLYLKPVTDFSGALELTVIAISTEPDGDSGEFPMTLKVELAPIVDQEDGQTVSTQGIEDSQIGLNLEPSVNQDVDGSESLTGYVIDSLPADLTLYFDGSVIDVPVSGLDLESLLDSTTPTLSELLSSGRLSVTATEDLSGTFSIPITYEVTDTSPTGSTDVKDISGSISVTVDARVESDTRLESSGQLYLSEDGSPVNVSDAVTFVDADMDGSEYLDYILIDVPDGYSLIIDHPNGAAQDVSGNWIISANGLTSDSIQELAQEILSGMTISSPSDTPVLDIVVRARVIDGEDSKYIDTSFQIQITGHDGGGGTCDPVGPPSPIQPGGDIKTNEGEDIDLTGLLNTNVASDPDNTISFYIPADSLPEGVEISGDGVIAEYDAAGEVVGYSITADGLSKLTLTGLDEDFAGCIDFTIETIETSPCNGETVTTAQTISIQVLPVVDDITVAADSTTIQEDIATDLNLELVLGDSVEDGQLIEGEGNSATGKETVNSLTITVSNGVTLSESPADTGLLVDNGNGTWTVTDPSRLSDVLVTPPEHYSGDITLTVTANITDEADCVVETDTQDKTTVVTITVEPVADAANLVTEDIVGDEDHYISLSSLSAELIDQDGSENMSLALKGVPEGAVVAIKVGDSYELVPNNGVDGGTFDGNPSYEWQLDPSQLANLVIMPPRDFSGDMNLVLEAITQEIGTTEIRYTESEFTVGVNPIGDKVEFFDLPEQLTGSEDDGIVIPLDANSFETNSDEFLAITVTVNGTSDPSGLVGLDRIRIGSETSSFTSVGGIIQATILVKASSVDELEFFAGDAFGNLDITITGRTVDQNTVLGELVVDTGDPSSQDMTLIITPEPDAPLLSVEYSSIVAEASGTIPLGLDLSLVNPADSEVGFITIYDIPAGLTFSHGSMVDSQYVVDLADVPNLAITGGYDGVDPFEITIEPSAEIGNNQAVGLPQTVSVEFVAEGDSTITATDDNDLLIGGTGSDNFVFASSGLGSAEAPSYDVIQDFDASPDTDAIDLSGILGSLGLNTGLGATQYLDLEESGEGVTISIKPNGDDDVQQNILLTDVTYDDLYQGDSSSALEAQILQKMIDDNNLTL